MVFGAGTWSPPFPLSSSSPLPFSTFLHLSLTFLSPPLRWSHPVVSSFSFSFSGIQELFLSPDVVWKLGGVS